MKIYKKDSSLSRTVFDLEKKQKQIEKLTRESATPDFWEDNERAAKVSQELADVKEEIDVFQKLKKEIIDIDETREMLGIKKSTSQDEEDPQSKEQEKSSPSKSATNDKKKSSGDKA